MINYINKQVNREDYIVDKCRGKKVLNIGCLAADKKAKLHEKIEEVSSDVWGLDIFDSDIKNYIKGDAQAFSMDKKFDVIVIGEVIEHLWDIKGMFESAYSSLSTGGKLIVTTPNAYAPIFIKNSIFGKVVLNDPYHVLLFDVTTITNLLNNFASELFKGEVFYYEETEASSVAYKIQRLISKLKNGYSRGIMCELIKSK